MANCFEFVMNYPLNSLRMNYTPTDSKSNINLNFFYANKKNTSPDFVFIEVYERKKHEIILPSMVDTNLCFHTVKH